MTAATYACPAVEVTHVDSPRIAHLISKVAGNAKQPRGALPYADQVSCLDDTLLCTIRCSFVQLHEQNEGIGHDAASKDGKGPARLQSEADYAATLKRSKTCTRPSVINHVRPPRDCASFRCACASTRLP
jgi:hypothetical protein